MLDYFIFLLNVNAHITTQTAPLFNTLRKGLKMRDLIIGYLKNELLHNVCNIRKLKFACCYKMNADDENNADQLIMTY